MLRLSSVLAALALAAAPQLSSAAVVTYFDQGAFEAAAGPTTLFDFNSTPDGSFDGTSYDVGPFTLEGDSTGPFTDLQVTGGLVQANVCSDCGTGFGYRIVFDAPITAFGARFFGASTSSGLTFTVDGAVSVGGPTGNDQFFGFVSDVAFTKIQVSGDDEVHEFDDVRFRAGVVPEPGAWALMIAGFGLVGATLRRRASVAA